MNSARAWKTPHLAIIFLLLSATFLTISIPRAHAAVSIVQKKPGANMLASLPITFTSNVVSGDVIVVVEASITAALTPTDSQGNSYTKQIDDPVFHQTSIFSATAGSSGALTVTVKQTSANGLVGAIYELSGADPSAFATRTNSCTSSCSSDATTSNVNLPSSSAEFASDVGTGNTNGAGGTPNYTNDQQGNALACSCSMGVMSSTTAPSPTNFKYSNSASGPWTVSGAVFALASVTVVVACSFFELQCWWYPMLFFGIGLAPFMLVGGLGKVNPRGLMYLLLCGLVFTSLIEVLMGMINIMFPLIFTILAILYAVRIK